MPRDYRVSRGGYQAVECGYWHLWRYNPALAEELFTETQKIAQLRYKTYVSRRRRIGKSNPLSDLYQRSIRIFRVLLFHFIVEKSF